MSLLPAVAAPQRVDAAQLLPGLVTLLEFVACGLVLLLLLGGSSRVAAWLGGYRYQSYRLTAVAARTIRALVVREMPLPEATSLGCDLVATDGRAERQIRSAVQDFPPSSAAATHLQNLADHFAMSIAFTRRRGSILICVLVCLGIAASIMAVSVRSSLQTRRQMRNELQLEQTRWLLDAGVRRGVVRIREDPAYRGESRQVMPALASYPNAIVEIAVVPDRDSREQVTLNVSARIQAQTTHTESTQRSATLTVDRRWSNSEPE